MQYYNNSETFKESFDMKSTIKFIVLSWSTLNCNLEPTTNTFYCYNTPMNSRCGHGRVLVLLEEVLQVVVVHVLAVVQHEAVVVGVLEGVHRLEALVQVAEGGREGAQHDHLQVEVVNNRT